MTKGIDQIPGEHNAKGWFNIMAIKNWYFWLTLVGLTLLILQLFNLELCKDIVLGSANDGILAFILTVLGMLIPITVFLRCGIMLIAFWNQLKGKK
jgi:magnesium-transporting ATPase (P-type)